MERSDAPAVIVVVVRKKQRIDIVDVAPMRCQSIASRSPADASIKQQSRSADFDEETIAVAARLQCDDVHIQAL
jgi:hypothetical protein